MRNKFGANKVKIYGQDDNTKIPIGHIAPVSATIRRKNKAIVPVTLEYGIV